VGRELGTARAVGARERTALRRARDLETVVVHRAGEMGPAHAKRGPRGALPLPIRWRWRRHLRARHATAPCSRQALVTPCTGVDKSTDTPTIRGVGASPAFAAIMVLLAAPVWVGLYRLPLRRPVALAVCSIGFDCVIRTVLLVLLLRHVQPDEWSLDPGQLVKGCSS
jgi:hypothetical protein